MNLRLLQLGDSALPIGGYSHSWGLEAAIERGLVRDAPALESWTRLFLHHVLAPLEGVVVGAVVRVPECANQANRILWASLSAPTLRNASRDMGEQLLSLATAWQWGREVVARLRASSDSQWHHAVAFGCLAAKAEASPTEAVALFLHQAALGVISAGVRGVPIGHTHGQQILALLHDDIAELADRYYDNPWKPPAATVPPTRFCVMSRANSIRESSDLEAVSRPQDRWVAFHRKDSMEPGPSHYHGPKRRVFTIGVGGPVGSGKTALVEKLCRELWPKYNLAVVTNDIYTKEDAEFLARKEALPLDRIVGVETGGCPHSAIREDASINLAAIADLETKFAGLELVIVESGGDNLAATFSPELADCTIYVIDVAEGDKIPRKGGPGITRSDLLVINKIDLAPYVGADLDVMRRDSIKMRGERPFVLISLRQGSHVEDLMKWVDSQLGSLRKTS